MTNAEVDAFATSIALTLVDMEESGEVPFPVVITMTDSTGYKFLNHSWDGTARTVVLDFTVGGREPDWRRISLPITVEVTDTGGDYDTMEVTQTDIDATLAVARKGLQ